MQLVMLCPTLVDLGGHEYDYTKDVAAAALDTGAAVATVVPANAAHFPALPGRCENRLPTYGYPSAGLGRFITAIRRFFCYCRILRQSEPTPTLWFVHSAPQNELAVICLAWIFARRPGHNLSLFLRHDIGLSRIKNILVRLLTFASRRKVNFLSDSDTLAEKLGSWIKSPVTLLPIPVALPKPTQRRNDQITCGYFGARRQVKGFALLPSFVAAARQQMPNAQFVIQAYAHRDEILEPDIEKALAALRKQKNVRLIENALDSDSFARELSACHIIFIPYDAVNYKDATSGIFVMAVIARTVVVVTEQSWMERQTRKFGLSRVVLLPTHPTTQQINDSLRQAYEKLQQPDAPSQQERDWCNAQTADNLWRILKASIS